MSAELISEAFKDVFQIAFNMVFPYIALMLSSEFFVISGVNMFKLAREKNYLKMIGKLMLLVLSLLLFYWGINNTAFNASIIIYLSMVIGVLKGMVTITK